MNKEPNATEKDVQETKPPSNVPKIDLKGREKVAILLASLDIEKAARILQGLELPEEVTTKLLEQAATLDRIPADKVKATIREGIQYLQGTPSIDNIKAGPGYVQNILTKMFGERQSREILRRMGESSDILRSLTREKTGRFKFVTEDYVNDMIKILKDEHPQTVALILGHLDTEVAGQIITELSPEMQYDVIRRMGKIKVVDLDTIEEIGELLRQKLGVDEGNKRGKFYGVDYAAEALGSAPKEIQDNVLSQMAEDEPELAYDLERALFRFESLGRLSERELILILQDVEASTLAYAIRGISENLKDRILNSLPKRRRELVEEEIEIMPDRVLIREVDDAQREIVAIAQRMNEEGEITLVFDESEYI